MPHIAVKLYPGRTEDQKQRLAAALTRETMKQLGSDEKSISVTIEEIAPQQWQDTVYEPEIRAKSTQIYKKPGY